MLQTTTLCRPVHTSSTASLWVQRADFNELLNFARAAGSNEVCGYAFVTKVSPTEFCIVPDSVFITTQMVERIAAEPDARGEVEVMDREEDLPDGTFRLLWHSHVDGTAKFSGTDFDTHNRIGKTTLLDAMFFLVLNKRGEASANLEQYRPFRIGTQITLNVIDRVPVVDLTPYKDQIDAIYYPFPDKTGSELTLVPAMSH